MTESVSLLGKQISQPVFDSLQVLRGIAAFMIVLKHSLYEVYGGDAVTSGSFLSDYPLILGVDIFFVLSGFVMVYSTKGKNGTIQSSANFMIRRIIRIVPVYWFYSFLLLGVALVLPSALGSSVFEWTHFLKSLFFIPHDAPNGGGAIPFLANGWTLNFEMYFYVIFAVAMLFRPLVSLIFMSLYFVLSLLVFRMIGDWSVAATFYSNFIILDFLAGAWIGYVCVRGIRFPEKFCFAAWIVAGGILLSPFFISYMGLSIGRIGSLVISSGVVAFLALPNLSERIEAPRFLKAVGDSSYTLYLFHPFVVAGLVLVGHKRMKQI